MPLQAPNQYSIKAIPGVEDFLSRTQVLENGCRVWLRHLDRHGYGRLSIRELKSDGHVYGRLQSTHRHAFGLFYGPIPPGMFVCHRCDNPPCCEPLHLMLGNQKVNVRDCLAKGRRAPHPKGHHNGPRGEAQNFAKLNEASVREIRRLYAGGITSKELGERFGVGAKNIWYVVSRNSWKHVE